MAQTQYDLIVVGAGFAGLACAMEAARGGLRACVIDRKRDLGERLHTTGILVEEACREPLLREAPAALLRPVPRVRLYAPGLRSIALSAPGYRFFTTDTPALMRWLGAHAAAQGVDLRLGRSFAQAHRDAGGWHLPGIGRCRHLVGADGARSRVAQRLGLGRVRDFLHGVEHEFDGVAIREPDALHCFVSRRFAPGYIGWIAQTPRGVQAGLARRYRPGDAILPDITGFLAHCAAMTGLPASRRPDAVRAGLIPCGGPIRDIAGDGVCLIGDAAGVVSPVTAGGIHSSLRHGAWTGRALAAGTWTPAAATEAARRAVPGQCFKRTLRWAFDHGQCDWPMDLLLKSAPLRRFAEQIYFHRRGAGTGDGEPS